MTIPENPALALAELLNGEPLSNLDQMLVLMQNSGHRRLYATGSGSGDEGFVDAMIFDDNSPVNWDFHNDFHLVVDAFLSMDSGWNYNDSGGEVRLWIDLDMPEGERVKVQVSDYVEELVSRDTEFFA